MGSNRLLFKSRGFFNKVDEKHAGASSMASRAIYPITVRDTGRPSELIKKQSTNYRNDLYV